MKLTLKTLYTDLLALRDFFIDKGAELESRIDGLCKVRTLDIELFNNNVIERIEALEKQNQERMNEVDHIYEVLESLLVATLKHNAKVNDSKPQRMTMAEYNAEAAQAKPLLVETLLNSISSGDTIKILEVLSKYAY